MKRMERVIGVQIISVSFGPVGRSVGRRLRKARAEALPLRELTPAMGRRDKQHVGRRQRTVPSLAVEDK